MTTNLIPTKSELIYSRYDTGSSTSLALLY